MDKVGLNGRYLCLKMTFSKVTMQAIKDLDYFVYIAPSDMISKFMPLMKVCFDKKQLDIVCFNWCL